MLFGCDIYQEDEMTRYEGLITLGYGANDDATEAVRAALGSVTGSRPTPEPIVGGDWAPSQSHEGWEKPVEGGRLIAYLYTIEPNRPLRTIPIDERVEENEMTEQEADAIIAEGLSILTAN